MNQRIKTIFADAQKLTPAEREELAELLIATIDSDAGIETAWAEEANRRWHEHAQSGEEPVDAFAAVSDVRRIIKKTSGE